MRLGKEALFVALRTVTCVTAAGDGLWSKAPQGGVGMSEVHTYESWRRGVLIEERNEKPLRIALFAVIVAWAIAVVIALA
jgi:hypothetical protein